MALTPQHLKIEEQMKEFLGGNIRYYKLPRNSAQQLIVTYQFTVWMRYVQIKKMMKSIDTKQYKSSDSTKKSYNIKVKVCFQNLYIRLIQQTSITMPLLIFDPN